MMSLVERIADAVLYEGYILYPYRPTAVKNQQRWNFGALCPRTYSEAQGGTESWSMQTECLVETGSNPTLDLRLRFLHLMEREVGELIADCRLPIEDCGHTQTESGHHFKLVPRLEVNGTLFQTWQEATERDVCWPGTKLRELVARPQELRFTFTANTQVEELRDEASGQIAGVILRRQQTIDGTIEITAQRAGDNVLKITIGIRNLTPLENVLDRSRDEALMRSLVSTHTILGVADGRFVSLLDPPAALREAAAGCSNIGTYPVLAGEEGTRDCMLSSPIILYDYPQIAPESAGNLFDGTEIDEILTLRIMTLTEEEKREMRSSDARAREILERTETLPVEQLMKMHGVLRGK